MAGLDVMTAGAPPQYPAELLGSDNMTELVLNWRKQYDFIIIDGAPVLPVTDSVLLSSHSDLTLLVARYKVTERRSLERSCSILQTPGTQKIALVLNAFDPSSSTPYDYYGYNGGGYSGGTQWAS